MEYLQRKDSSSINDKLQEIYDENVLREVLGKYTEGIETDKSKQQRIFDVLNKPDDIAGTLCIFQLIISEELNLGRTEKSTILIKLLSKSLDSPDLWRKFLKIIDSNDENRKILLSIATVAHHKIHNIVAKYLNSLNFDGEFYYVNDPLLQDIAPAQMINFLHFILSQNDNLEEKYLRQYTKVLNECEHAKSLYESFKVLSM